MTEKLTAMQKQAKASRAYEKKTDIARIDVRVAELADADFYAAVTNFNNDPNKREKLKDWLIKNF
ncbi:MAG: hypothetical protein SVC26_02465 [Pseudomonadota bacterium]|nr:hypothetical protein [Pseudomonadota bacterium]